MASSSSNGQRATAVHTPVSSTATWARRLVTTLLVISGLLTFVYASATTYIATLVVQQHPLALQGSPADYQMDFRAVVFPARTDGLMLRGWFIPGLLPDGQQTTARTIIMIHGSMQNRTDPATGLVELSSALAHQGFAVLVFDMRGEGQSEAAPWSLGYFEQRDALGAVDFLRHGPLPYPALGRPRMIGGWGVSMGGITLLLAAAHEPAIKALVADSAYPDIAPILEREIPKQGGLPAFFTPGALAAARALYGIDFYNVKPGDVVASLAPRPLFFIQGAGDVFNPPSNLDVLVHDAEAAPNANVQSWLVPSAGHAQSFHFQGSIYVSRLVAFYTAALGSPGGA
jgi:pimeloyl-ACP methyl ester carboxylesterase